MLMIVLIFLSTLLGLSTNESCQACYNEKQNTNCPSISSNISYHTLHMSVHPHLDAFWIYDFEAYYDDKINSEARSYMNGNKFSTVKKIFNTILEVLQNSKKKRQGEGMWLQNAHRSFFNSEMGFFKRWYFELKQQQKNMVKELLKSKYWQIVGGGYVEHDQATTYYDDIIENFQTGLRFLKEEFGYFPRSAISADSFGHSQSTLAILAHLGIEGFLVERSDEHILLQNKTQFIWKAKSSNELYYGALPTHIRWAIHGFEDQFIPRSNLGKYECKQISGYIQNMKRENEFLKNILKSNHIMRYFGHDFQEFTQQSYHVIQTIMQQFSMDKCRKVIATYGNPTEYFIILMSQVFGKVKPIATREQDIMPIWDYDSGLYWTGYYTTDPYHKKIYRDAGRYLIAARKIFTPSYIADPSSKKSKQHYQLLQLLAETVSYLQHHDGMTGTSKYKVLDNYQKMVMNQINQVNKLIFSQMFQNQFPANTSHPIFNCSLQSECQIPSLSTMNHIYLKIFKTGGDNTRHQPIVVHLPQNQFYQPNCEYQINCFCMEMPCACDLYLYPQLPMTYNLIQLKKTNKMPKQANFLHLVTKKEQQFIHYNDTHFSITHQGNQYNIGYKKMDGIQTRRSYQHLSRYGVKTKRSLLIKSGKYALGNNIKTLRTISSIRKILKLQSQKKIKYIIIWNRQKMKTIITLDKTKTNIWKIQTISASQSGQIQDLYLEINAPHINNKKKFYTDSNGWLVMKRQLFKHEDYQAQFSSQQLDNINGNSYPITSFVYIIDQQHKNYKMSINTDRPQGVIAYQPGTIWINYDRLTLDDGKWVFQKTYRAQYQKFVHYVTVDNVDGYQRVLQKSYDQPLIIQGNSVNQQLQHTNLVSQRDTMRQKWQAKIGIHKVKFYIRPFNDSSLLFQVHNLQDNHNTTIQLFSFSQNMSTFLTYYYGNTIKYQKIIQTNLGGNIQYKQLIQKKWNWNHIIDLKKQNQIFNKQFQQIISLRPLQIRTFLLKGITIDIQLCKNIDQIQYSNQKILYQLNTDKLMPIRSIDDKQIQNRLINYLLNQNHCNVKSPVNQIGKIDRYDKIVVPGEVQKKQQKIGKQQQKIQQIRQQIIVNQQKIEKINKPISIQEQKNIELQRIKVLVKQRKILTKQLKQIYFDNVKQSIKKRIQINNPFGSPLQQNPHTINNN